MGRRQQLGAPCFALSLTLCAIAASHATAASVKIAAGSHQGALKSAIVVPISLSGAPGLGAIEFDLVYDPNVCTAGKVEKGSLASNTMMESSVNQPGRVRVALVSQGGISGDGALVTVHFTASGSGETALGLENARAWAVPKAAEGASGPQHLVDVQAVTEPGRLKVGGGIPRFALLAGGALVALVVIYVMVRSKRRAAA